MKQRILYYFLISLCFIFSACTPQKKYITISGYAQGGTYAVTLNLIGKNGYIDKSVKELEHDVDSILLAIDNSVSGYNKGSILSKFNNGEKVKPDNIFIDLYKKSYFYYEETDGALDVASGALFDAWGFGFKSNELPSKEEVEELLAAIGMDLLKPNINIEELVDSLGFLEPSLLLKEEYKNIYPVLNFNAIAQGYSSDLVASYLDELGVEDYLVNIGEISSKGLNSRGEAWTIGLDAPIDGNDRPGEQLQGIFSLPIQASGVVTSGNYRKFYIKDGKKYAHIIDPRTGYPVEHNLLSVTILAPTATEADAYTTYCMVIGLEEAKAFINSRKELEACFVYEAENKMSVWTSPGFTLQNP